MLFKPFTISNNRQGFEPSFQRIVSVPDDPTKVTAELEATGHYSYNFLGFLLDKGLQTYIINLLHTSLYKKSLSLRKTKTDKLEKLVPTLHIASVYALLSEFPGVSHMASAHLIRLTSLLSETSKGR